MVQLKTKYNHQINEEGYYTIEQYDRQSTFASFFAGIAGVEGKPLWTFYVNRGQCISSFGIRDKSKAVMEFFPANEAYKQVYATGFRTFVKFENGTVYEPFAPTMKHTIERTMRIRNNDLIIEEQNNELQLRTKVTYFTIPNENFGGFVRKVEVINESAKEQTLEVIDGVPALLPPGVDNDAYKAIANTIRSWMQGDVLADGLAVYKIRSSTGDTSRVSKIEERYFAYSTVNGERSSMIVDPELIFGYDTSYQQPVSIMENKHKETRTTVYNKVPCAFTMGTKTVRANESFHVTTVIGYCEREEQLQAFIEKMEQPSYFTEKLDETNALIGEMTKHVKTKTAFPLFDEYVNQCYVDNVLRGGYPISVGNQTYYVYSRKHGDLERDYNFFTIEPTYYSQGNGNFRDLNQNRRLDTYLHPFVEEENIHLFYSLMQLDGYNPLVIKGKLFKVSGEEAVQNVLHFIEDEQKQNAATFIQKSFSVGELFAWIRTLCVDKQQETTLLEIIMNEATAEFDAEYGEGFWIDHWTYNLDFIDSYLEIYPERKDSLLYGPRSYSFFSSPEYVVPRHEKYVVENGNVRQYDALGHRHTNGKWEKTANGEEYKTTLMTKLIMLATLKFTTLDPDGFGIEMEGNKPGWNDSMNGLPGLIGSSTAERFELQRLLVFMKQSVTKDSVLPVEFHTMLAPLQKAIHASLQNEMNNQSYWDYTTTLREQYRYIVKEGVSGEEAVYTAEELHKLMDSMLEKLQVTEQCMKKQCTSFIPTYFYYKVTNYEVMNETVEATFVKPLSFERVELPAFLEGAARYFKLTKDEEERKELYHFVRESGIYDEKLGMYKTSASLEDETMEIGRARGFTAGWLERESVFMHMEFKYLLELIKNGLYNEFFTDIQTALPPFMNPDVYGRSVLENSSFIASSANPDERVHGKGFVARLSGTTIEFLHIWKTMMVGHQLFRYENGELQATLAPILTADFFNENNEVCTTILGRTHVTYRNNARLHTFGENGGKVVEMELHEQDGTVTIVKGNTITGEFAHKMRDGVITTVKATIK